MKFGFRVIRIGVLLLPAVLWAQTGGPRVRVGGGYSVPWAYLGPDGTPTGLYVEVMKEAARREGLAFEIVFRKDGPEKALRSGEIDLWAAAVPTEERRKNLYFTAPWWSQDHYLGVMSSSDINDVSGLTGKTVAYSTSPPFTADLASALPSAKLKPINDLVSRFRAVCDGDADAVLFYHETALFSITGSNEFAECRERGIRLFPLGRTIMETAIATLPENRELADRFRRRIDEMRRDQTLSRLASSPLTGTQPLTQMLQPERSEHQHTLLQLTVLSLSLILLLGAVAYFRLRRANRQTRDALAAAEQASRAKSEFLATMSHEIRTPLTAVLGFMDMLQGTPLRHDQRRYATEVTQATAALLTLMTTILEFARPVPQPAAPGETLDVAAVMDDCLAAVLLEAEDKGLALTIDVAPSVPSLLHGDATRLRQCVLNLISNAVKFTQHGYVRVYVNYDLGHLTCIIADSGPGIPAAKRDKVFEPFTQIDSTDNRQHGGVGLGLAVVADICRQLNGTISVTEAEGGGAQFTLRLPYRKVDGAPGWLALQVQGAAVVLAEDSPAVQSLLSNLRQTGLQVERVSTVAELAQWSPPTTGPVYCFVEGATVPGWRDSRTILVLLGRMSYIRSLDEARKSAFDDILPLPASARSIREILQPAALRSLPEPAPIRSHVLVVDDNAVNRRVISALLEKLGCRVDSVRNGREAVDAVLRTRYAAVLMDCQMPVLNGYDATREIRRHSLPEVATVPICGLSASTDEETRARCDAAGMNEYMPKPVTLDNLRDLLTRLAARRILAENR